MDQANATLKGKYDADGVVAALTTLSQLNNDAMAELSQGVNAALKAVHDFAKIRDEELQMLWWLFGNRSVKLDRPFPDVTAEAQTLILAAELAWITWPIGFSSLIGCSFIL